MSRNKFRWIFILQLAFVMNVATAEAVPLAVVDSGLDIVHPMIVKKLWINAKEVPGDKQDNDFNSYVDDMHGWNFVDNNNQLLDYQFIGTFTQTVSEFYNVQSKVSRGIATSEEVDWAKVQLEQPMFAEQLARFSTFIHGTHVAGITARTSPKVSVMGLKVLGGSSGKSTKTSFNEVIANPFEGFLGILRIETVEDSKIKASLDKTIDDEIKILRNFSLYLVDKEIQVANCSWGIAYQAVKRHVYSLGHSVFNRSLTDYEIQKYIAYFYDKILNEGTNFVHMSHKTLFTIAAGNDGSDNDIYPMYPANLLEKNVLSVAATRGYQELASFSNFGVQNVDIAAPGVDISSSVPGSEMMALSGTSMAAPFIASIAGRILDANPKLNIGQVKDILMRTVDKKEFLSSRVKSGGIANERRAIRAAELSVDSTLDEAIRKAREEITDSIPFTTLGEPLAEGLPIPLPSPFEFEG